MIAVDDRAASACSEQVRETRVVLLGPGSGAVEIELKTVAPDLALECVSFPSEPTAEQVSNCDVVVADASRLTKEASSSELGRIVSSLARSDPALRVLAVCTAGDEEAAREAALAGVWDVVEIGSAAVAERVRNAANLHRLASHPETPESPSPLVGLELDGDRGQAGKILGRSPAIRALFSLVDRVADDDVPVLLTGESGTGKEVMARAIHALSRRRDGPFVPINCGAIPESLLESELFGHERGAFTGAVRSRSGRFEAAEGGTLFLDEIGEMHPHLQVKLLRFLEDHVVEPVGGNDRRKLDVRVLAATNCDLAHAVEEGEFREDLYYRLAVFNLQLPPLRERGEDAVEIARYVLARDCAEAGRRLCGFSSEALVALREAPWPGNVRELNNRVRRAVVVAEGPLVEPEDLGLTPPALEEPILLLREARSRAELETVLAALRRTGWNKSAAARKLDISRTQLYELLHRHGITGEG